MATLCKYKKSTRRILFKAPDGTRSTLYLGTMPLKRAQIFKTRLEDLVWAARSGQSPSAETSAWAHILDDVMHGKLVAAGLVSPRESEPETGGKDCTLSVFLDKYLKSRTDLKLNTRSKLEQVRRNLLEFFGPDKPLRAVTPADTDQFRIFLLSRLRMGINTVRRNCGRAKQFFRAAQRSRLIAENPFADMRDCTVRADPTRFCFITSEESQRVLEACPDAQWRLIFALARFGGLRVPSELLGLRWLDVDWDRSRITIHSPKTEHHEGKGIRQIPIFPELRPYLDEVFDQAEPGSDWIITRYRNGNANLRTQLHRIIERAGLIPWGKPFQNLRSTRETELVKNFPIHIVCSWIGNTAGVASKHYLQVTDADFDRASNFEQVSESNAQSSALLTKVTPKAAQPPPAMLRQNPSKEKPKALLDKDFDRQVVSTPANLEIIKLPDKGSNLGPSG